MEILEKLRKLNKFMQKTAAQWVDFNEVADVLSEIINCSVYVISRRGKVLGSSSSSTDLIELDDFLTEDYLNKILSISEPTVEKAEFLPGEETAVLPAYSGRDRMATLILTRSEDSFSEEEMVLGEYGATVVALEIIRSKREKTEEAEEEIAEAKKALESLSYSELEIISLIFEKFEGDEKILVTGEIADKAGISRSVVVNALNKLESAGVLEASSMGMKGTHIKLLNEKFLGEINKLE